MVNTNDVINYAEFDFSFEQIVNKSTTKKRQIIANAISYLKKIDLKTLIDDQTAYEAITLIRSLMETEMTSCEEIADLGGCDKLFGDILLELYTLSITTDPIASSQQLLAYILHIVVYLCEKCADFNAAFGSHEGLKAFIELHQNDDLLTKIVPVQLTESTSSSIDFVDFFVMNMNVLSRFYEADNLCIDHKRAVHVLLEFAKLKPSSELRAYIAICNIACDKIIETLTEIHKVASVLAKMVAMVANEFLTSLRTIRRRKMQIWDDCRLIDGEVGFIESENEQVFLTTMLRGLYNLAVNDKLRCEIYKANGMKCHLKVIMAKGNAIEQLFALKLLCQLSFNGHIAEDISGDKEVVDYLNADTTGDSCLADLKQTLLWKLKTRKVVNGEKRKTTKDEFNNHIMISYNSQSRDICLKVKDALEENGYKVWIDVADMHGSSMNAMAKAVENSFCVLICVTEFYRQSLYCQAEAEYAFKLNKPIIPLILESGKENVSGWLGILMASKRYINFAKTNSKFDECLLKLKYELNFYLNRFDGNQPIPSVAVVDKDESSAKTSETANQQQTSKHNDQTNSNKSIEDWNEDQVENWFVDKKIDPIIAKKILPCDGNILKQLYELKQKAPEYFFILLDKDRCLELRSVLRLNASLDKLFS